MSKLYFYLCVIAFTACKQSEDSDLQENEDSDNHFSHGLNEVDSVPLQDVIDVFDFQFPGDDLNSDSAQITLKIRLDSLKAELELDPKNEFLKTEIADIEASFRMIEFIEKDIARRDSVLNSIVPGIDTLMPK